MTSALLLDRATLQDLAQHLKAIGVDEVWLYGSVAKGTPTPTSDVDIFVVAPKDVQREIDRRYAFHYPQLIVDGVPREAHIFTETITGTNDSTFFKKMQPEARRIDVIEPTMIPPHEPKAIRPPGIELDNIKQYPHSDFQRLAGETGYHASHYLDIVYEMPQGEILRSRWIYTYNHIEMIMEADDFVAVHIKYANTPIEVMEWKILRREISDEDAEAMMYGGYLRNEPRDVAYFFKRDVERWKRVRSEIVSNKAYYPPAITNLNSVLDGGHRIIALYTLGLRCIEVWQLVYPTVEYVAQGLKTSPPSPTPVKDHKYWADYWRKNPLR